MNAEDKIVRQRLSVPELARALGNLRQGCRQRGMARSRFHVVGGPFQTHGLSGLRDLPPVHTTHPWTTPPDVAEKIPALSLEADPCFREHHLERERPGERPAQDTFIVGHLKGVGEVSPHAVVDTCGSYAFGFLHASTEPEAAVAVLHNQASPFHREKGIAVSAVPTDNRRESCGTDTHPFGLYPALGEIGHRRTRGWHPRTNGVVERFNRTVLDEFFRTTFRTTFCDTVVTLQADLDARIHHCNHERPRRGYRNMGKRPVGTVNHSIKNVHTEAE